MLCNKEVDTQGLVSMEMPGVKNTGHFFLAINMLSLEFQ